MNSSTQKIKEKLSIVDIISSYITIEKAGKNYKARCPFHNEKTPSFFISEERGSYYCFGCGAKGDIFSFVEHFEGTDFLGSLKILALRAGIELDSFKSNTQDKNDIYFNILEDATLFFEKKFLENKEARSYLLNRGLNDNSIKNFRIGYAPMSWNDLLNHLTKIGYKKEDIEKVGLIKNKDNRYYDRFRGRIMFPINDTSGRVIAFSGRMLEKNAKEIQEAKYINSPDTPLFNKSNVLFGLDKAKSSIKIRDYTIIVEGQFDLILSHQAGFTNTVAVSGTAFTDTVNENENKINNLGLIRRLSSNIIFAYDGDDAGNRASYRSSMIALSLDMQVKIAVFPKGKDPADIISNNYKQWEEIIKNKVDIISYHINKIVENIQNKEIIRKQIEEKIFSFLILINSSIKKSNYIKEIHDKTGISEQAINEDYKKYEKLNISLNLFNTKKVDKKEIVSRRDNLQKRLFSIILWKGEKDDEINLINTQKVKFEEYIGIDEYKKMLTLYEPFADNLVFEAERWYSGKIDLLQNDMEEIILNLEEDILNNEAYKLSIIIKEKEKKKEDINIEIKNYQKLVEKIENIKNKRFK